jgi:hypothetical protein
MDILDKNAESEPEEIALAEEFVEVPTEIDHDKLLEDEIKKRLVKNEKKLPHHKCSRCGKDLGTIDQWFNYAIKPVHFGFTMIPQPLCKSCFKDFEAFMHAFDKK